MGSRITLTLLAIAALALAPAASADENGTWRSFVTAGLPNSEDALVASDPVARKVYLFGPRSEQAHGGNSNETYVLDLAAVPPRLQPLPTTGTKPAPRYGAALVFDPVRHRLLLFGGRSFRASITETETWELSLDGLPRWRRLQPGGVAPGPRVYAVAVHDPRRDRVILYGGARIEGELDYSLGDAWELSLSSQLTWSPLATAGADPPALAGASGIYDSRRDQLLIYGGGPNSGSHNASQNLWHLTLSDTPTWSLESTSGTPPQGFSHDAVYDSTLDRLCVVTSELQTSTRGSIEVSRMNLGSGRLWESVPSNGADPGSRFLPASTLIGHDLVIVAGSTHRQLQSDAYALDLETDVWRDLEPIGMSAPLDMSFAPLCFEDAGARAFILGRPPELWVLRLEPVPTLQRRTIHGSGPELFVTPKAVVWDPAGERILVVDDTATPTAKVWTLDPDPVPTWSVLETGNAGPTSRSGTSAFLDRRRNRLIVAGGSENGVFDEVWQLELARTPTWSTLPPLPSARSRPLLAWDESRDLLVSYGGAVGVAWAEGLYARPLDADEQPWQTLTASGGPPGAQGNLVHDAARDRFLAGTSMYQEVWALKLAPAPTWSKLMPSAPPPEEAVGPAFMDPERDRWVFPLPSARAGTQLRFGTALAPQLACPANGFRSPGSIRDISFALTDQAGAGLTYEYTITTARDWPGLPIRGIVTPHAFATALALVRIPIPDTSAAGAVEFTLHARAMGQGGLEASCTFVLEDEAAPVVALGADADPDRAVVRWRTTVPGITATIARRPVGGEWEAIDSRFLAGPGEFAYSDPVVQSEQRYEYRAEITNPDRAGAYAPITVDVPKWSLTFASDLPNPVRGRFTIDCAVGAPGRVELRVFDLNGRVAYAATRDASGPGRLSFDLDAGRRLSPAMYFLQLTQGAQRRHRTIVLLR